jgi:Outer membrane lipoprotein
VTNLRLVADEPTAIERMILDASRAELPSEEHKLRVRAALGLGAPLPAELGGAALQAGPAVAARSAAISKVAVGAFGLALVTAGIWLTRTPSSPSPVAAPPEVAARPVSEPPRAVVAPPLAPQPAQPADAGQASSPAPAGQASSPAPAAERAPAPAKRRASPSAADLTEQMRLIEAARGGVAARDPRAALSALDSYASAFPRGSFGQEAQVLRIRALDQQGDVARATAMAKSFIARFPNSPHVARLQPIAERGASR